MNKTGKLYALFLALPLALGGPGLRADQNDERLDELFRQLKEAENPVQAYPLEERIWTIWMQHENAGYQQQMMTGISQMNRNDLRGALATYTRLVEQAPDYAEAWNKRATIHYLLGDYEASRADIDRTLALEPFHFGALSGLGLVCLAQQDFLRARNAFNAALEVYPTMQGVISNLQALERMLRESTI